MSKHQNSKMEASDPILYQIRIKGHLGTIWNDWFEGLTILFEENGDTQITGPIDQAALHGLLRKIRDLGIPLISINQVNSDS